MNLEFILGKSKELAESADPQFDQFLRNAEDYAKRENIDILGQIYGIRILGYQSLVKKNLTLARERARSANPGFFRFLKSAEKYARYINNDISSVTNEIERLGNYNMIPKELRDAEVAAEKGSPFFEIHLSNASKYAQRVGEDTTKHERGIRYMGLKRSLPALLTQAKEQAKRGDSNFEKKLSKANKFANELGEDIEEEIDSIKQIGYYNQIPEYIETANHLASVGISGFERYLENAKEVAEHLGEDVSLFLDEFSQEIYKRGVKNCIKKELEDARSLAREQDPYLFNHLTLAQHYNQISDTDFSNEIEEVRRLGNYNLIPKYLEKAEDLARKGDRGYRGFLDIASNKASLVEEDLGEHTKRIHMLYKYSN